MKSRILMFTVLVLANSIPVINRGFAQGTVFTYQGRLITTNGPAAGAYDMAFTLYDAAGGGNVVGNALTNSAVTVTNGLFTVPLDFGNVFDGNARWLEIGVRTNGAENFVTLSPRQLLTASPQSIYSQNAGTAGVANTVSGTATIQGQSLDIGASNSVSGAYAAIAGGGSNTVSGDYGVVSGGHGNTVSAGYSGVGGGSDNAAAGNHSTVGGGEGNIAGGDHSTVAGGEGNSAMGDHGAIGGGAFNSVIDYDVIAGGESNVIDSSWSVVAGGLFNHVFEAPGTYWQTISGGVVNRTYARAATIGGGEANFIESNAVEGTIGGGTINAIYLD
ncbi:MAG: hypothetical protein KGR98_08265, partial [Verrucomicrobia bacterium]|nr:hypothetical protein [Verrucomicrobiota bacterium]